MAERLTKTEQKELARQLLMNGIGNVLGYWAETNRSVPADQIDEVNQVMWREADRVAKLLGYEQAWSN